MEHDCISSGNPVYFLDKMFLCAGCYARRALSVHGKEAQFLNGSLTMVEYKDLTYLDPANEALVLRAKLYKEYLSTQN